MSNVKHDKEPYQEGGDPFLDERKTSGEHIQLIIRPDVKQMLLALAGLLLVAVGIFFVTRYICLENFRFRYPRNATYVAAVPSGLFALFASWVILKPLLTTYEITRRYITEKTHHIVYKTQNTCDMVQVIDVNMIDSMGLCSLIIDTKDKSSPKIRMVFLEPVAAKRAFDFIRRHATSTYNEFQTARLR